MPSSLCPVLVQRDDELAILEAALISAHGGEGGLAVLSGEAGIGKTRLANEVARLARQLGNQVLWGTCSEAELSLPYLPFVEALGKYLDGQDSGAVTSRLGPSSRDLSQLFPQLADGAGPEQPGDSEQAKLRLFEAIVSLLSIPAGTMGCSSWSRTFTGPTTSTRELLDHIARRVSGLRALVLITYRSDELHRRHPFVPVLQGWRRSGLAEVVELRPLPERGVAEMLQAILGPDRVDPELAGADAGAHRGQPVRPRGDGEGGDRGRGVAQQANRSSSARRPMTPRSRRRYATRSCFGSRASTPEHVARSRPRPRSGGRSTTRSWWRLRPPRGDRAIGAGRGGFPAAPRGAPGAAGALPLASCADPGGDLHRHRDAAPPGHSRAGGRRPRRAGANGPRGPGAPSPRRRSVG